MGVIQVALIVCVLCFLLVFIFEIQRKGKTEEQISVIKYGRSSETAGTYEESMFQVIMVTKSVLKDKKDHNVIYGALEKDFIYIVDADESITKDLVYGKFYLCDVYKDTNGVVDYVELKGEK
ncbi:hypothetical protein [Bacteroides acidifaciens]|uniref:hypothetical protein n=1 Tax=Bacteroides acidifaciens TaxID=85831 RepID=UPI0025A983CA|nr:hypothetical protein [Bacteroides acidifaciens]